MSKIKNNIQKIYNFIIHGIWRITGTELSRTRRFFYNIIKTLVLAIRGFVSENLNVKSSALTYSILFAIVPIFAIVISIARGFGVEQLIEHALEDTYIGKMNMIPFVMGFVEKYLETAQGGVFIGVGIVILMWSIVSFFMQVESAFNDIWQVKTSRSIVRQFTTYFASILLIPILIIVASGLSIYINSTLSDSFLFDIISPFIRLLVKLSPFFLSWIVFTILYMVIPNTRVKFSSAFWAGVVAGTAFQLFQILYIHGQVYLSRYNAVYGGFAAIPLLLLWLNISCLIILFGAQLSYAAQNIHNYDYETDTKNISLRYRNFLLLFITYLVVKQFEKKEPPLTSDQIAITHNIPIRLTNKMLSKLVETSILIEVYNEENRSKSYQPAVDIHQLTAGYVLDRIGSFGSELFLSKQNDPLMNTFWNKTLELRDATINEANKILIKDIY